VADSAKPRHTNSSPGDLTRELDAMVLKNARSCDRILRDALADLGEGCTQARMSRDPVALLLNKSIPQQQNAEHS
jgi:hypothetical protein